MNMTLVEEIQASLVDGYLPCAAAFKVAEKVKVPLKAVGDETNELKLRIIDCQLGCFQFAKAVHDDLDSIQVDSTMAEAVQTSIIDGHLPCAVAFKVAKDQNAGPMKAADAANKLHIKINKCQLGCFP